MWHLVVCKWLIHVLHRLKNPILDGFSTTNSTVKEPLLYLIYGWMCSVHWYILAWGIIYTRQFGEIVYRQRQGMEQILALWSSPERIDCYSTGVPPVYKLDLLGMRTLPTGLNPLITNKEIVVYVFLFQMVKTNIRKWFWLAQDTMRWNGIYRSNISG